MRIICLNNIEMSIILFNQFAQQHPPNMQHLCTFLTNIYKVSAMDLISLVHLIKKFWLFDYENGTEMVINHGKCMLSQVIGSPCVSGKGENRLSV